MILELYSIHFHVSWLSVLSRDLYWSHFLASSTSISSFCHPPALQGRSSTWAFTLGSTFFGYTAAGPYLQPVPFVCSTKYFALFKSATGLQSGLALLKTAGSDYSCTALGSAHVSAVSFAAYSD